MLDPASSEFDYLIEKSRTVHGHRYILPVAVWIFESGKTDVTAADAMVGLGGRADRPRIIESLARLTAIGALRELPRVGQRNAPRYFERVEDPYWAYIEETVAYLEAGRPNLQTVFERP